MKSFILLFLLLILSGGTNAQCLSSKNGIMGCEQNTTLEAPFLELAISQGIHDTRLFNNVSRIEANYITKYNIAYGASFGVVPNGFNSKHVTTGINIGYYFKCLLPMINIGATNITTMRINDNLEPVIHKGWHTNISYSLRFISGTVTFGAVGSTTGILLSIGKIF